jgi:CRP-like cAMP-binding protein
VVFIAINLYQLWRLMEYARGARHAPELAALRKSVLAGLDDAQLGRLFRTGLWRNAAAGETLTEEGQPVPALYLLCSGHASVEVEGDVVARLAPGAFVGEMAFLSGAPASATVRTEEPAHIFAFDPAKLRRLITLDEQISSAMHRSVGQDLTTKLRRSTHHRVMSMA